MRRAFSHTVLPVIVTPLAAAILAAMSSGVFSVSSSGALSFAASIATPFCPLNGGPMFNDCEDC